MTDEVWQRSRLFSVNGIGGAAEQEDRATSALLAVMEIVPSFTRSLIGQFDAPPHGKIETYFHPRFTVKGDTVIPDGVIRIKGMKRTWTALVEVKTGKSELENVQLENYLEVVKENKFDALITISNQISPMPGIHPTHVSKRFKNLKLFHLPWSEILMKAITEKDHKGVADFEQSWIVGELIRYLEHPKSGALNFDSMGKHWNDMRDSVIHGVLKTSDPHVSELTSRWSALLQFSALQLSQKLGENATVVLTKAELEDPALKMQSLGEELHQQGTLSGAIKIPTLGSTLCVKADIRTAHVTISFTVGAPQDRGNKARVGWLVRQLSEAVPGLRLESSYEKSRMTTAALLSTARNDAGVLYEADLQKDIKNFCIAHAYQLGLKNGAGKNTFITSVLESIDDFYETVAKRIVPWEDKRAVEKTQFVITNTDGWRIIEKSRRAAYVAYMRVLFEQNDERLDLLWDVPQIRIEAKEDVPQDKQKLYAEILPGVMLYQVYSAEAINEVIAKISEIFHNDLAMHEQPIPG